MGNFYQTLSKWTRIDDILCPYSPKIFEKVVNRYGLGARGLAAIGGISSIAAAVFVICAVALAMLIGKQIYLGTYGVDAQAQMISQSTQMSTDRRGRRTEWRNVEYSFKTREGRNIVSAVNRPAEEMTSIPARAETFTTAYWDTFPSVNLPHGIRFKALEINAMATFLALLAMHFAVLAWRFLTWRRLILAPS